MGIARAKLVTAGILLAGACGYMAYAAATSEWVYYQEVDQVVRGAAGQKRVRVHGLVASEGLCLHPADLSSEFSMLGDTHKLPVEYRGPVPDGLRAGAVVVAEGCLDDRGVLLADVLLTKCSSKYRSQLGEQPGPMAVPP